MNRASLPNVGEICRHPPRGLICVASLNLEALRISLIAHHREAFEEASLDSFDPSNWMARAVAEQIGALIASLGLYEEALRCADDAVEDF